MATQVGELLIKMSADVAQLKSDMAESKRLVRDATGDMKEAFEEAKKALETIGVGLSFAELTRQFLELAESVRAIGESSERLGMTAEQFQQMSYSMKLAGGDADKTQMAIGKLDMLIGQAAGGTQTAIDKFRALGVEYKNADGSMRDAWSVMQDLAQVFSSHADGSAKAAWAMEIFGRSGRELIPMLNDGRAGLQANSDELDKLGLATQKEIDDAKEFEQQLTKLKTIGDTLARTLADPLVVALTKIAEAFIEAKKQGDGFWGSLNAADKALNKQMDKAIGHKNEGFIDFLTPSVRPWFRRQFGLPEDGSAATPGSDSMQSFIAGHASLAHSEEQDQLPGLPSKTGPSEMDRLTRSLQEQLIALADGKDGLDRYKVALAAIATGSSGEGALAIVAQITALNDAMAVQSNMTKAWEAQQKASYKAEQDELRRTAIAEQDFMNQAIKYGEEQIKQQTEVNKYAARNTGGEDAIRRQIDGHGQTAAAAQKAALAEQMAAEFTSKAYGMEGDALQKLIAEYIRHRDVTLQLFDEEQAKAREWSTGWNDAFTQFKDNAGDSASHAKTVFNDMSTGMTDALTSFVMTGKLNFNNLTNQIVSDLIRIQIQKQMAGIFGGGGGLLGSLFGGGSDAPPISASGFGGACASGGDVNSGSAYLVGEQGPELFVPKAGGTIVPTQQTKAMMAASNAIHIVNAPTINIDSRTDGAQISATISQAMMESESRIYESMRRKGPMAVSR